MRLEQQQVHESTYPRLLRSRFAWRMGVPPVSVATSPNARTGRVSPVFSMAPPYWAPVSWANITYSLTYLVRCEQSLKSDR